MRELRLYLDAGLSALPADRAGKRPSVASWREYQKRLPRGSLECNPEIPAFPGEEN